MANETRKAFVKRRVADTIVNAIIQDDQLTAKEINEELNRIGRQCGYYDLVPKPIAQKRLPQTRIDWLKKKIKLRLWKNYDLKPSEARAKIKALKEPKTKKSLKEQMSFT